MILDLERGESPPPEFSADVCIVGAGAAGIALAAELVHQGKRVVLLESGGASLEDAAQALNQGAYSGQAHRGANIGRFRALGGTTTVWGGQILELDKEDFEVRPWIPGSGWPISKDELQPYYDRAVESEGLSQAIQGDPEIWRHLHMAMPQLGEEFEPYFTRWCPKPNFARLFRGALDSDNLSVVLHATATRMILDESGVRVRGFQCRTPSGKEHIFTSEQYVLCQGTIESVRFLLQPLSSAQTPSWDRSGLLGRHFHSHIDMNAAHIPAEDATQLHPWFANVYLQGYKYHPKFRLTYPWQQRDGILNIAGSVTCIDPDEQELRWLKSLAVGLMRSPAAVGATFIDVPRVLRQLPAVLRLAYAYRVRHRAPWPKNSAFWLRTHCEQEPLSQNRITLTDERDATGLLRANLDWHVSPLEWRTIRRFTEHVKRDFAARNLARIVPLPELAVDDGFRNITFDDSHHHMGGARMAANAAKGVVDLDLRLHGVENAFVCSAAVFPTSGFSNPTHTLIALAIRLADRLSRVPYAPPGVREERKSLLESESRA